MVRGVATSRAGWWWGQSPVLASPRHPGPPPSCSLSGLCQRSMSSASLLKGHSLTSRAGPPVMSRTRDWSLWPRAGTAYGLPGLSGSHYWDIVAPSISLQFCVGSLWVLSSGLPREEWPWGGAGAGQRPWVRMEAGVSGWRLGWGLCECEHFLKPGVGTRSSEGSLSSLVLRIQEELGVGGSRRRSHRFFCALGPVLLTPGLHTHVQGTPGCPARVDCQGLPAQLKQQTCSPVGVTPLPTAGCQAQGDKGPGPQGKKLQCLE